MARSGSVRIRELGITDYRSTLERMREFTARRAACRGAASNPITDEIWLTEHPPVFTLGRDGNTRHIHGAGGIPVVETERGGQVTYHGPGQVVAYLLIDLRARRLGVRDFVCLIETGVIRYLAAWGIHATRKKGAPGLYVSDDKTTGGDASLLKIASIGLKISHGFSYHGVALNGRMDLEPFQRIDPCGFPGLRMTDVFTQASTDIPIDMRELSAGLGNALADAIDAWIER